MRAVATGTFTVLRGSGENAFGDETDVGTAVLTGVPMSVQETRRQTTRRADDRALTVLYFTGRCSAALDVRQGDRLQDERTGAVFLVSAISRVANPVAVNDARLDLERVSDGTTALVT